ncbi:MAG: universal stress protein [Gammaproteobacteria bacterium]|nr:universal stress protein [Gammaproteobacteria bacterium]
MSSYKNIVVGIDIYEPFDDFLNEAQKFAKLQSAKLHCVYVMPALTSTVPYAYEFQQTVETEALAALAKIKLNFACETLLLKGSASTQLCDYAQTINADLIVCGSHGKHGFDLLLGSTANGILHNAQSDVLTIRLDKDSRCMTHSEYRNIVLASDLKSSSKNSALKARDLAQLYRAKLHIVHAITYISATAGAYYPEIEADLKKEAELAMQKLALELDVDTAYTNIYLDVPKHAILDKAKQLNAELIVIGSKGKSALTSALLGSTANAVLHYSKCNVLVVRVQ